MLTKIYSEQTNKHIDAQTSVKSKKAFHLDACLPVGGGERRGRPDTTENITFPQQRCRAVMTDIITELFSEEN